MTNETFAYLILDSSLNWGIRGLLCIKKDRNAPF